MLIIDPTYLPNNQPTTLGAQNQDITILAARDSNAAYPLGKWNNALLVTLLPAVHVNDSLVCLGCKNM
jgi:hypothetical protein